MVFKKSLTPLSKKGHVNAHKGKGSTMQRTRPGERETLTGGDPMGRAMNTYPTAPAPPPNVAGAAPPPGGSIGPQPSAAMPPVGPPIPE